MMLRLGRVDRVVDGALDHSHVYLGGRRCPARRPREPSECVHRDQVPVTDCGGVRRRGGAADAPKTPSAAARRPRSPQQTDRLRAMFLRPSPHLNRPSCYSCRNHFAAAIGRPRTRTAWPEKRVPPVAAHVGLTAPIASRRQTADRDGERRLRWRPRGEQNLRLHGRPRAALELVELVYVSFTWLPPRAMYKVEGSFRGRSMGEQARCEMRSCWPPRSGTRRRSGSSTTAMRCRPMGGRGGRGWAKPMRSILSRSCSRRPGSAAGASTIRVTGAQRAGCMASPATCSPPAVVEVGSS